MSCNFANFTVPMIRAALVLGLATLSRFSAVNAADGPAMPVYGLDIVATVRHMLDTLKSPIAFRMDKGESDRYWHAKKMCVSRAEHAFNEDYPWCDDPDYTVLQRIQIAVMDEGRYDYFIHLWEHCPDRSASRAGLHCNYCADPRYLSIRQKRIDEMTGPELDFFMRCRRECVSSLIDSGYGYSLSHDLRYREALKTGYSKMTAQQQIFIMDVEHEAEKHKRKKAADAAVAVGAMALPTVVTVVVTVIVYLVAAEMNIRL